MKKYLIVLLLFVLLTLNALYSEEKSAYDNNYWEGISADILVKDLLADAKKEGLKNFTALIRGKAIAIIYRDIMFKPDSPVLTDETKVKLKILVKILAKFASKTFFIEGHTAKVVGEEAEGLVLSRQRASAVADFMANTDILKSSKFLTKGYGDTQPVSTTVMALNRRVEISIVDKLDENQPDNKKDEGKNLWWKILTDDKTPGYTVIVLKDEIWNKNYISKLLDSKHLDYKIYEKGKDLIIIFENKTFKNNSNELDDSSKDKIRQLFEILNKYKIITIRTGGTKDNDIEQAIKKQYIISQYFYNNSSRLKPENIYYSYNGEFLTNVEKRNKNLKDNTEDAFRFNKLVESVDISIIQTNPLGRLREFSIAGLGFGFMINLKIPGLEKIPVASWIRLSVEANGFCHFLDPTSSMEGLWEFSWDVGIGLKFVDLPYFDFLLRTKYGGTLIFLTATRQDYGYVTGKPFYDQTLSIESEFDIKTKKRNDNDKLIISVFITPGYRLFFDKDYLGHTIYEKTGVRFNF